MTFTNPGSAANAKIISDLGTSQRPLHSYKIRLDILQTVANKSGSPYWTHLELFSSHSRTRFVFGMPTNLTEIYPGGWSGTGSEAGFFFRQGSRKKALNDAHQRIAAALVRGDKSDPRSIFEDREGSIWLSTHDQMLSIS